MIEHVKLIESKRRINCISECMFEYFFDRFEELLNLVLFIFSIVLDLVANRVIIANKSIRPNFQ